LSVQDCASHGAWTVNNPLVPNISYVIDFATKWIQRLFAGLLQKYFLQTEVDVKRVTVLMIAGLLSLTFAGCKSETPEPAEQAIAPAEQAAPAAQGEGGKVVETMASGGYTYVLVDTGSEQVWAAAPEFAVAVGDDVFIPNGMVMQNHTSKTLDRTFEKILFVDAVQVGGAAASAALPDGHPAQDAMPTDHVKPAVTADDVDLSGVAKAEQTVGEIFAQKDALAGKEVSIRGKVVKFSQQIMQTNWVHLQDGTGAEGTNDLVVTTDAVVAKGDTVLVKGVVTANKDFGFGYKYDVIIEGAQVTVE
jgi:hypothetical protein